MNGQLEAVPAVIERLSLVVDAISITFNAPDPVRESIRMAIQGSGVQRCRDRNYNFAGRVYLGDMLPGEASPTTVLEVATDARQPSMRNCRVSWNPAKVAPHVIARQGIEALFGVPYELLVEDGLVTRYDVAVDVRGIHVDDVAVYDPNLIVACAYLKGGATRYLGSRQSRRSICIYDRVPRIRALNRKLAPELREPLPPDPVLRIEVRLRPSIWLRQLVDLENPFDTVSVIDVQSTGARRSADPVPRLVLRLARYEGLRAALTQLPKNRQRALRKQLLENLACPWWDPTDIWAAHDDWAARLLDPMSETCSSVGLVAA